MAVFTVQMSRGLVDPAAVDHPLMAIPAYTLDLDRGEMRIVALQAILGMVGDLMYQHVFGLAVACRAQLGSCGRWLVRAMADRAFCFPATGVSHGGQFFVAGDA